MFGGLIPPSILVGGNLKYDFRMNPNSDEGGRFGLWLEEQTIDSLRRSHGNLEQLKSAIFLYVNRAYESHMKESDIGGLFGKCVVRAGFTEQEEEPAFAWLEYFGQIAAKVHA